MVKLIRNADAGATRRMMIHTSALRLQLIRPVAER